ncbi:MAG: hypothetical protein M0T77_02105 [Actinomycetota bacterium]|nr:hypothetical protein [Actinomycetota bacterium]
MLTAQYGTRRVDSLTKKEAARFAEARPHVGASASAMYNDLIRYMDGFDSINPFA